MAQLSNAIKIIRSQSQPLGTEIVSLSESLWRVLAEDITSDINIPPFNKSALDGFACRKVDLPGPLKLVDDIPAGKYPTIKIGEGECARIMTGAPVPEGADTVFMVENHELQADGSVLFTNEITSRNICIQGEDANIGDTVLKKGTLVFAPEIAIMASVGAEKVKVYTVPEIGIISTGSELIEPNETPVRGLIRNTNGIQLMSQLKEIGISAHYYGIVSDDKILLQEKIEKAFEQCNVVFISGGVSIGDYDFVPQVILGMGFEIFLTGIDTKPGRHTIFAEKDGKYLLGFPGNPVSTYVQMELIGKQLIYSIMGTLIEDCVFKVILIDDFKRKNSNRLEFVPVIISETGKAELINYNGSAHINALSKANALMEIPIGVKSLEKGDMVYVRPL